MMSLPLLLLLMLLPSVCKSYSYDEYTVGRSYSISLPGAAQLVVFTPSDNFHDEKILWNRNNPGEAEGSGWMKKRYSLVKKLAHRDSGRYSVKDGNHMTIRTENIKVVADSKTFELKNGQSFEFKIDLEPRSCNIYYFPEENDEQILIVHEGKTKYEFYMGCHGLELLKPCGIYASNSNPSCRGRFTIRDEFGDVAMEVKLEFESSEMDTISIFFVIAGFIIVVIVVCCCVVRCCFSRESRQKNTSQPAPAPQPAVNYSEYDREPARLTRDQPNEPTRTQPVTQSTATNPLIHCPLPLDEPPSYSEVCPRFQEPQTPPPSFQGEPRFEVTGANFDLSTPLHSDPPQSDVYNSDKLNFL